MLSHENCVDPPELAAEEGRDGRGRASETTLNSDDASEADDLVRFGAGAAGVSSAIPFLSVSTTSGTGVLDAR